MALDSDGDAARSRLTVQVVPGPDAVVAALVGDLDLESTEELRRVVREVLPGRPRLLVLDLTGLRFCDSSGLNELLRSRADALESSVRLRLAGVPDQTVRLLRITGADTVFEIYPDTEAAVAATA